jgi:alpha-L-rhamnosidase
MPLWLDRRAFLHNCLVWAASTPVRAGLTGHSARYLGGQSPTEPDITPASLESGFSVPPEWAKPWVYWWWLNGYVTREGLVRDLDEMKRQGISGVLVFNAGGGPTPKTIAFMSQEWRDLFRFAVQEAGKRSIKVSLNLCSGWNAGGPWITAEEAPQKLVFSKLRIQGPKLFEGLIQEPEHPDNPYYRDVAVLAHRLEPRSICRSDSVQELSHRLDSDNRLTWQVPDGEWLLLRIGHTVSPRAHIKLSGLKDSGYEIDPLRPDTMDRHFAATAGKILEDVKPWVGGTLDYFHIDSWEIGNPDWSPTFRNDFRRLRGYDLIPYLAAMAGETVDNRETTLRFIEDFHVTLGDLTSGNYYGRLVELSHRAGVGAHPESAGYQKAYEDSLKSLGLSDIPMGEYWARVTQPDGYIHQRSAAQLRWSDSIKGASSAAHIYGRSVVQGEAFTVLKAVDWSEYPFALKDIGDRAFCAGLNRNVLCFYVHQPDLNAVPGYEWPGCGIKVDRNVTWWPMSHAWLRYLARCQFLFRRGRFVADVCYFYGEDVPNYVPAKDSMIPSLPKGFDCDSINGDALLSRMSVRNHRLYLPNGINYRLLILPYESYTMPPSEIFFSEENAYPRGSGGLPVGISPRVLRKVKELVEDGATVLGPKPLRAPGLSGYPHSDQETRMLADELWGDIGGETSGQRNIGKGRVIWGKSIAEIFEQDRILPDFSFGNDARNTNLDYIHYTSEAAEIYFVSNQTLQFVEAECRFRVSGRQPELWDPVTGAIRGLPEFNDEQGQTVIPMAFAPRQSFFVIFRRASQTAALSRKRPRNFPKLEMVQKISGPWQVSFDPRWGGPERVVFEKLVHWTERPEAGIHYYSGIATYGKTFDLQAAVDDSFLFLDLGAVKYLAAVRLNGIDLGVVWTAPWQVEVTKALKTRDNVLEIDIVNLWPNRLIGDAALPPEERFTKTNVTPDSTWPLFPSGLLGPVTVWKDIHWG